jgi:hypothetical protein
MEPTLINGALASLAICVLYTLWIDCHQTLQIKDHPELHETNPILGRHPSDVKVIVYFVLCATALALITIFCPRPLLSIAVMSGTLSLEVWVIRRNFKLGL